MKKFTVKSMLAANILAIIVMLLVGYADHIDPREHAVLANAGFAMPFMIVINAAFLVFWLIFKWRLIVVPIIGFIISWGPVRRYCPLNIPSNPPAGAIKVISFNVWMFSHGVQADDKVNPIADYLVNSGADIICLQEAGCPEKTYRPIDSLMATVYQYRDTIQKTNATGDVLAVYSKFPIISHKRIKYESKGNISAAFFLKINGEKLLLVNNHFETVGLSPQDKDRFHSLVHGTMEDDSTRGESRFIIDKLATGTVKRAPQADAVARYIDTYRKKGMSVIVCGDFNDSPLSYTHRTVAKGLTDCFVATGNGPGWSYHKSGIRVRIDNILCSPDLKPYGAKIDHSCTYSDHYPIVCWLKKR